MLTVYYRRGNETEYRVIGQVSEAAARYLPTSAQTGMVVGGVFRDGVYIYDFTTYGLHWPYQWPETVRP
jgi:hypothetical protein